MKVVLLAAALGAALLLLAHLLQRAPDSSTEPPVELFTVELRRGAGAKAAVVRIEAFSGSAGVPSLTEIPDGALVSKNRTLPIGEVHSRGLLHRGCWLFVRDRRGRILLMRRSEHTVTCPSAWSLVGEHSMAGETWEQTARRSLTEELAVPASLTTLNIEMLGKPLLFKTDYSTDGGWMAGSGRKQDLQATALLTVTLPDEVLPDLRFDDDVADTRWTSLASLARLAPENGAQPPAFANSGTKVSQANRTRFCNPPIRALLALAVARLQQHDAEVERRASGRGTAAEQSLTAGSSMVASLIGTAGHWPHDPRMRR